MSYIDNGERKEMGRETKKKRKGKEMSHGRPPLQ
jgi:hypothetical protein